MQVVILDTSIVVHYLKNSPLINAVNADLGLNTQNVTPVISSVTKGELISFARQRKWGESRISELDNFLLSIASVDIHYSNNDLHDAYANIDAFSKRKIPDASGNMLPHAAVTMGKNDLWIAATAFILNVPLVTTDNDFSHLANVFIDVRIY